MGVESAAATITIIITHFKPTRPFIPPRISQSHATYRLYLHHIFY